MCNAVSGARIGTFTPQTDLITFRSKTDIVIALLPGYFIYGILLNLLSRPAYRQVGTRNVWKRWGISLNTHMQLSACTTERSY